MTEILHGSLGAAVGPVGSEVGRSPSTLSPGQSVPAGGLAPGQRWSVGRKREVVLRLLRGEAAESLSRELGVPVYRLERWRERALLGIDGALREREGDAVSEELAAAMRRVGELTMENEVLRARVGHARPFGRRGARRGAPGALRGVGGAEVGGAPAATSPGTGGFCGVACVCEGFGVPRSSFFIAPRPQAGDLGR